MVIQFQIRELEDEDQVRQQVVADVKNLNRLIAVVSARVALQCQRPVTPPYQAVAMLRVAGPDIRAAARDHTWPAAWRKVVTRLREQMEQRRSCQRARSESPPDTHNTANQRTKVKTTPPAGAEELGLEPRKIQK